MQNLLKYSVFSAGSLLLLTCAARAQNGAAPAPGPLGIFESETDVGAPKLVGSCQYDASTGVYRVKGSGANMWAKTDAFHFVWKKLSGDFSLTADIAWPEPGKMPHRKACLIVRGGLDAGSPYADAAFHGVGLTSLQYREDADQITGEIRANVTDATTFRIERRGGVIWMSWARTGEPLRPAGGSVRLAALPDAVYVGLGVCAHDATAMEEADFSNVRLENPLPPPSPNPRTESTLEILTIKSGQRDVVYNAFGRFEAPNWSRDGKTLIVNRDGRICAIPVAGGELAPIDTGTVTRCNNDHCLSADGTLLAISSADKPQGSRIYIVPVGGGTPRLITPLGPSYCHGWSPDGRTLAFCGARNGNFDVYTISVDGGEEHRLTTVPELDDGPEYSPDGEWIYFNSARTDRMQIWRMRPDGSGQEQITHDGLNNWFAHPSPNGKWLAFISFTPDVPKDKHIPNQNVVLRLVDADGRTEPRTLVRLFGGQGTMNVPSWSPDGTRIAYVSYRLDYE